MAGMSRKSADWGRRRRWKTSRTLHNVAQDSVLAGPVIVCLRQSPFLTTACSLV